MKRYKNLIHNSINAFISNYLIDGQLIGIKGFDDISAFLHEKYPYMSIAYMLNINSLQDDYEKFIDEYKKEIEYEIKSFEKLFGTFLSYTDKFHNLEVVINNLCTRNQELTDKNKDLSDSLYAQENEIRKCKQVIANLKEQISALKEERPKSSETSPGDSDNPEYCDANSIDTSQETTKEKYGRHVPPKDTLWFDDASKELRFDGGSYKFIEVEGGSFMMGANKYDSYAYDFEKPRHEVTIDSFAIGETQVTQALWKAVVLAWKKDLEQKGSHRKYLYKKLKEDPSKIKGDNRPVESVSWKDCQIFIGMLNQLTGKNFSLPTEAQWEYAARGGKHSHNYKFSGANILDNVAWYSDNSGNKTHPVREKHCNELGLYDMSGNVWEWCEDWLGDYSKSIKHNPSGPSNGSDRVNRGGCYCDDAGFCRVSRRDHSSPGNDFDFLGLRLVLRP